ncbi:MAG TPA: ice-binding family protein [Labilithrix sp.]|nr:ice-binding family protein [Labilithrix sp.]
MIAKKRTTSSISAVSLVVLASACSASAGGDVTARLELLGHREDALASASITSISGTYGADCDGRSASGTDAWTLSDLRVRKNDSDCVLAVTNIVTLGATYLGDPPIALDTTNAYPTGASAFGVAGGPLAFHANAKISALTFSDDFTISLLVSDAPSAVDAGSRAAIVAQPGTVPALRGAGRFAILGGSTVTNDGTGTTIDGDLGLSPGISVTGVPPGQPTGATFLGADAVAAQAQADLKTVYDDLAGRECIAANTLSGQDLAGRTLARGVYCFAATAVLGAGTLTLDANGDPNAYWVFQIGSALSVAASTVTVINGGTPCNVFWQVGTSATVLDNALFAGNIVALTSITLDANASISPGRALARDGAVTMSTNHVSKATCP